MSNKGEIRRQITRKESERGTKQIELIDLKDDLRRLKEALKEVESSQDDFTSAKSLYDKTEISDLDWKGQTRSKSDTHKDDIDKEMKSVADDFDESITDLKNDISKKEIEISGVEGEISSLTSEINILRAKL
ncbi:DUF5082 domain-containing protein [Staphylococcus sp. SQ8-PEA]|uniref:DUF5082 domain-containing protein n=1 Tax=Staphylococcus marylandisciuri TaxID=2981529 RepID=A0ABT2QNV6_9STAP|nr:DUF5082 domain-containing protein [Staphylococcus marylandisciuri]MCU5745668.1 DUF5082 domain-containing protein [Staphylococcus marylandisciuri]